MSESKKNKDRSKKVEKFKEQAKKANAQAAIPRTHMLPQTEWQSTDILEMRGDIAEAFEIHMVKAFEALQAAGAAFQQLMAMNIQAGKVKISYIWNNGEIPTEEEVQQYKQAVELMQKRREEFAKAQQGGQQSETALTTVGGEPLTEENLEKEKGGLIIAP